MKKTKAILKKFDFYRQLAFEDLLTEKEAFIKLMKQLKKLRPGFNVNELEDEVCIINAEIASRTHS